MDPEAAGEGLHGPGYAGYAAGALLGLALGPLFPPAPASGDDAPRDVTIRLSALWCPWGEGLIGRAFGPLGYAVDTARVPASLERPWAGRSPFHSAELSGRQRLSDAWAQLRILLPIFHGRRAGAIETDGERALSVEALERFVRGEPLARVHSCVFGALAARSGSGRLGAASVSPGAR